MEHCGLSVTIVSPVKMCDSITSCLYIQWIEFRPLRHCIKSQKSHSEFQAVKTEVEHTVFAIAAMFV